MSGPVHYTWRKLGAAKWEDAWVERLRWISDRLAITSLAGAKTIRLEAYELTKVQAEQLREGFGGVIALQKKQRAISEFVRAPIRVRDKLIVAASAQERAALAKAAPDRKVLVIPAGMAFGTGDHATTAACLRFLADVSVELGAQSWEMLDLGCGSGILALAGSLLGARRALAGDFDPHAVRTAKENVRGNAIAGVTVKKLDVLTWQPPRVWDVVAANLYSGLLIESAPRIAAACARGGRLIFSGILRAQEAEVIPVLKKAGFEILRLIRKGKWVAGLAARK
jgi:ribosomal protein L11 methyltransferase